jgi:hypothetical protein
VARSLLLCSVNRNRRGFVCTAMVLLAAILLSVDRTAAQTCNASLLPASLSSPERETVRAAELIGRARFENTVVARSSSVRALGGFCVDTTTPGLDHANVSAIRGGFEAGILPAELLASYQSAYPRDRNNGALWSGRGVSGSITSGIYARLGFLSAAIAPVATYSANTSFRVAESLTDSEYGAAWMSDIDYPQRFGAGSLQEVSLGDSYVRADLHGFAAGISNESVWWGPQRFFPIIMSNTSAGFPHFFIGTGRPVNVGIGRLQGEFTWGELSESDFFDQDEANDDRLFAGIAIGIEPRGLRGLWLGVTRAYHKSIPPDGLSISEILRAPYTEIQRNIGAGDNNLLSVFARWAMAPAGFELYGEWARDDGWEGGGDLIREIDHSQGYGIGFQKIVADSSRMYRVYGELLHLESALPYRAGRSVVTFYQNGSVVQGHTQRGQLLGAWIGPGGDSQILGVDRIRDGTEIGAYLQRARYNDDIYYTNFGPQFGGSGHDVELTAGVRGSQRWGTIRVFGELALSRRWNRSFVDLEQSLGSAEWNGSLVLNAEWAGLRFRF